MGCKGDLLGPFFFYKANDRDMNNKVKSLEEQVKILQEENAYLKRLLNPKKEGEVVIVPEPFQSIFDEAEKNVGEYFKEVFTNASNGEIIINDERYVLVRAASLSFEFIDVVKEMYSERSESEALSIANNFLFDIAHALGKKDAINFHESMDLKDPVQKLAAGPVHFAYTGWANVEILPESIPSPDNNYYLKFHHHNSFEAQSWLRAKKKSDQPVCIMNSGYSSGWCEESFGFKLTAVEISCEARGDERCTFIMAPPNKIVEYLDLENVQEEGKSYDVPVFFQRKITDQKLHESLEQKETLLREVHHRVKNNLQVITSLLKLQMESIEDEGLKDKFQSTVNRVGTMARIHEMIYGGKSLTSIDVEHYIIEILQSLTHIYLKPDQHVELDIKIDMINANMNPDRAIPLGLIINEIAVNSFKHAFGDQGKFFLHLSENESEVLVKVGDNGKGIIEDSKEGALGRTLIPILCEQIDAKLEVENSSEGLIYTIRFSRFDGNGWRYPS